MKRFLVLTGLLSVLGASSLLAPSAYAQQSDAILELKPSRTQANAGEELEVDIILKNPSLQKVISVRSWLEYDPSALEALSLSAQGSPFSLSAPGEDEISVSERLIKVGRSNISGGATGAETFVAKVRFRVKATQPVTTVIDFHNYQLTELGHVSVNIVDQGFPINILASKPDPLRIDLNGGASQASPIVEPNFGALLGRPQNLRVATGEGFADLKWDMGTEPALRGYNLYYGKVSGYYTRRRTIGMADAHRLEGLQNGESYYFAVTAYDSAGRESDYSDEVGVIVGEPLSSTSPFEDFLGSLLAEIPAQPQNGPMVWWLSLSSFGLALMLLRRKAFSS